MLEGMMRGEGRGAGSRGEGEEGGIDEREK